MEYVFHLVLQKLLRVAVVIKAELGEVVEVIEDFAFVFKHVPHVVDERHGLDDSFNVQ